MPSRRREAPITAPARGWTIPRAALISEMDVHRSISPPCTKYVPKRLDSHVAEARMIPRRDLVRMPLSDPGACEPRPLPKPKCFFSNLPKDKGGFLSRTSEGADFMMQPKGIGSTHTKGGVIPKVGRFSPMPGAGTPMPISSSDFSVLDLPPPTHCRGAVISKTPQPRGGGTKWRPSFNDSRVVSAFEKCTVPDVSFAAARFATRSILMDGDEYDTIDDPKLKADEAFLKSVREDIARWKLKSALH
jgi:hypothetical protein